MTDDSLFEFPCEFPIKMMGADTPRFHAVVRALVENHTGPLDDARIRHASSRNGRFISITVTVTARSRLQLDEIYRDLSASEDILMVL